MVVDQLQTLLSETYALELKYHVRDFLLTDPAVADELDSTGRVVDEKLLIAEHDGEASVSLYLDPALLGRLDRNNPACQLSAENIEDFWTALEGVSHFLYYAWNAALEKSVTLMEMELQAEVDKFVAAALLLQRQEGGLPRGLHQWLFDLPRFDDRLAPEELDRYRAANRYAGKYCRKLAQRLADRADPATLKDELCYFYRLSQPAKLQHIDAG
jgi:hypothetical protein